MSKEMEDKIREGLNDFADDGFDLENLKQELSERFEKKLAIKPKSNRRGKYLLVVLGLMIILALTYFLGGFSRNQSNHQSVYAQHFDVAPFVIGSTQRGESVNTIVVDTLMDLAKIKYQRKEYKKSLIYLDQWTNLNGTNDEVSLHKAIINLNLGNAAESIELLNSIKLTEIKDMRDWYVALAYLKDGDSVNAKRILTLIKSDKKHYKSNQARLMLEQL